MTKIPEVKREIFSSIVVDIMGPQSDPDWFENSFTHICIKNPIVAEYLLEVRKKSGEDSAATGLVVYKIIESQMEADELKELFKE